jgi:hypothetical protein
MPVNPPESADDGVQGFPPREPSSSPKTIGILNIIFGCVMILCGVCAGFYLAVFAAMGPLMAQTQQQMQARMDAQQQAQIKALEDQEKAGKTPEEKAAIRAEIAKVQTTPAPKMPDIKKMYGMDKPEVAAWAIGEAITGMILNLAMIVAGIALVGFREWGRIMALWVAAIKILRLLALYGYCIVVVVPLVAKGQMEAIEEMMRSMPAGGGGFNAQQLNQVGTIYGTLYTVSAISMMVFGIIYPVVTLIVLTRPGAKAACTARRMAYE